MKKKVDLFKMEGKKRKKRKTIVTYPLDLKAMMVAIGRGGAAHTTYKFCPCCETMNTIRMNIYYKEEEFGKEDFENLKQRWKDDPDISKFKPLRSEIVDRVGVRLQPSSWKKKKKRKRIYQE